MSYTELEGREDRERLMSIAFTLQRGTSDGEHAMQCNPKFIAMQKARQKDLDRANKRK